MNEFSDLVKSLQCCYLDKKKFKNLDENDKENLLEIIDSLEKEKKKKLYIE